MFNYKPTYDTFIASDVISEIVTSIQTSGLPRFDFGNYPEIIANLKDLKTKKYPFILLPLPSIICNKLSFDTIDNFDFDIYIITETFSKYSASQNKNIFENDLNPIYSSFYNAFKQNEWFRTSTRDIEHQRQDLYSVGYENDANELNDFVNAIYLRFRNINVNKI